MCYVCFCGFHSPRTDTSHYDWQLLRHRLRSRTQMYSSVLAGKRSMKKIHVFSHSCKQRRVCHVASIVIIIIIIIGRLNVA